MFFSYDCGDDIAVSAPMNSTLLLCCHCCGSCPTLEYPGIVPVYRHDTVWFIVVTRTVTTAPNMTTTHTAGAQAMMIVEPMAMGHDLLVGRPVVHLVGQAANQVRG